MTQVAEPDTERLRELETSTRAAYAAGRLTVADAGETLARARGCATEALIIARLVGQLAAADHMPEARIARELGVDRMTLRKWLGKR